MVMGGDVCSVTKQVGGTATVFCVFVCVCLCAYVRTPMYACKRMCGTEACSNFIQINSLNIWRNISNQTFA